MHSFIQSNHPPIHTSIHPSKVSIHQSVHLFIQSILLSNHPVIPRSIHPGIQSIPPSFSVFPTVPDQISSVVSPDRCSSVFLSAKQLSCPLSLLLAVLSVSLCVLSLLLWLSLSVWHSPALSASSSWPPLRPPPLNSLPLSASLDQTAAWIHKHNIIKQSKDTTTAF